MATININIPDAAAPRVIDALCTGGFYNPDDGMTRAAFAKSEVARMIKERVLAVEQRAIEEAARASIAGIADVDVT